MCFSLIFLTRHWSNNVCCILISFEEIIGSNQVFCAMHPQKVGNHTGASGLLLLFCRLASWSVTFCHRISHCDVWLKQIWLMPREDRIVPALWAWAKHSVFFPIWCCHTKSWQISCPGTSTPNRMSLTGQGFQLQPESTLRKQCLCWEWIPTPASLLGCGQILPCQMGQKPICHCYYNELL